MPFLGRADWGGPFNAYYEALGNLGFVRCECCHLPGHVSIRFCSRTSC